MHQDPRLDVLHLPAGALDLPSSVLQRPSCTSGAPLRCTAFAIMAVATTEADEAIASFVFVRSWVYLSKSCWPGSFWSFLVTSPRLILRSGYGHDWNLCYNCWMSRIENYVFKEIFLESQLNHITLSNFLQDEFLDVHTCTK